MNIKPLTAIADKGWPAAFLIGIALSIPLWLWGVPRGNDLPHHFRLAIGFYDAFASGDAYPSWLAMTNGGLGDPSVRFYPPGLYVLLAFFRFVGGSWYFATLITFSILTLLSSLGSYLYARTICPTRYAILAAVIYPLTPFHANELYQAGMYGQYAAACIVPFVFAFLERLLKDQSWLNAIFLAFSYALVILFHVPMAIFATMAVVIYAGVRLRQNLDFRAIGLIVGGLALGAAISCFYWVPVIRELAWKKPSGAGQGEWFNYANNFIFTTLPGETANYWIPILVGFTLLMLVSAIFAIFRQRSLVLAPVVLAVVTFLMSTKLSKPLWDLIPSLQETQFPWRWLTLTSLFLSVASAAALSEIHPFWTTRLRPLAIAVAGIAAIVLSFTLSQVIRTAIYIDRAGFDQSTEALRGSATNEDFLPLWAGAVSGSSMEDVETDRSVRVATWEAEHKRFAVGAGPAGEVKLKLFYYPLWTVKTGDQPVPTKPDSDGRLLVELPAETSTVSVDFVEPRSTMVSGVISIIALLGALILWASAAAGTYPLRR